MRKVLAAIFMIALMFQIPLQAAYLTNVPQTLKQPDGKVLNCFATGDEFHNWLHDANNYTIIQDPATGYFVYASKAGSKLVATKLIAGQADPAAAGLEPGLNLDPADIAKLIHKFDAPELKGMTGGNTIGTLNNIVIFIRFSDQSEYTNSVSTYQTAFNGASGVSMSQFFNEVSGSQLAINTTLFPATGGTTVVSYQDIHPRAYYLAYNATTNTLGYPEEERTQREMTLLKNATLSVKSEIESTGLDYDLNNDGSIDNICYIIQGASAGWSDLLWPHMWSLYTDNVQVGGLRVYKFNFQLSSAFGVSVLCHEMSHSLGFPDLYRYTDKTINPVGQWDLMASNATPPQHQNSYTKWKYGKWFSGMQTISTPGTYTLEPLSANPFAGYKIVSPKNASEFFVVEYRKKTGTFESGLPGSGLIIYRVNSSLGGNSGGPPDEVYVYRPGGTTTVTGNLTSAPFSANSGRTSFTATSDPTCFLSDGSKGGIEITNIGTAGETISFTLSYPVITPELSVTPSLQNMAFGGGTTSFSVENINEGNMDWTAAVSSGNTWLHITAGSSGMNSGVIELTADANPVENQRTGTIVITAAGVTGSPKTVTVVQSGNLPVVVISPAKYLTRSAAGSTTFNVSNGGGGNLVWTAAVTSGNTWASVLSGASGINDGTITVSFDSNPGESIRTGVITVTAAGATGSPKSVTIEQAGTGPMLMVTPETRTIAFNEGSTSFSVSNGGGGTMAWTAAVTAGNQWARISSGASGSNSGTINLSVDQNTTDAPRSATITVTSAGTFGSPMTVTLIQSENKPALLVLPASQTVPFTAGLVNFRVSNIGGGNLNWTAAVTEGASWIRLNSGSAGTNNGTINLIVDDNYENITRTGVITITAPGASGSEQTVTIRQLSDLSGIDQNRINSTFEVYPNPANDQVTVRIADYGGAGQKLEVLNILGSVELTQTLIRENTFIDLSGMAKGVYFFRVSSENRTPGVIRVIRN